jgi:hypothetical protein
MEVTFFLRCFSLLNLQMGSWWPSFFIASKLSPLLQ